MQVEKYLKEHQPVIYKTFFNALKNKKLSHAYLISGDIGTPLYEVATFLAKSIICDDPNPFACNNCITCLRVESENYPDFIVFDGSKESIKKNDLKSIEQQFDKKAFESKGIMIYILHLVENTSPGSINTILKFLEEPGNQIYAFLTTNNEASILPTIVSRCQHLHLKLIDKNTVIQESISLGVEKIDAEFLSYFYNNSELIYEYIQDKNNDYFEAKDSFLKLIASFMEEDALLPIYLIDKEVIPKSKNKVFARFFLDLLAQFFENLVFYKNGKTIFLTSLYDNIVAISNKFSHPEDCLVEILKCKNQLNGKINSSLLFDHLIIYITKEL